MEALTIKPLDGYKYRIMRTMGIDILEEFLNVTLVSVRPHNGVGQRVTYQNCVKLGRPFNGHVNARYTQFETKLTASSIALLASFMVESGVSLGYVIRTCRCVEVALTLMAASTRGRKKSLMLVSGCKVALYYTYNEVTTWPTKA